MNVELSLNYCELSLNYNEIIDELTSYYCWTIIELSLSAHHIIIELAWHHKLKALETIEKTTFWRLLAAALKKNTFSPYTLGWSRPFHWGI